MPVGQSVVTQTGINAPELVVAGAVSIPDLKDRFSPVPIYIAGYTDLVIRFPLTDVASSVGWSKGNELACLPGR